jgi:hypothetical protein
MGSGGSTGTGSRAGNLSDRNEPVSDPSFGGLLCRWIGGALVIQLAAAIPASTQQLHYESPSSAQPSGFQVDAEARPLLHGLWEASTAAGAERVACIGGDLRDGVGHITRVLILESGNADSLGISASASIDRCSPPQWFGTAHTHIALYDGQHRYPNFSGADRGVMMLWWRRWTVDGVFCVLYSSTEAHCELQGASASLIAGPGTRVTY